MEFTKSQIAGLVLGYLKSEKCFKAFDEFLEASQYFQHNKQNIKMGKYFVTRVSGMCLLDYLEEYATIYCIVQARLEATNYFNEGHTKSTLVEQLLYLLDKEGVSSENSTTPTPPPSSASEVDTTPAHSLPGNNCSESPISKTPKRKTSRSRSTTTKDKDEVFDVSEVLTQSLLENHELHEKIAETINIVRNTPEASKTVSDEHISAGASKELDAIIKTVVQRTEEDPVYNKLIDEIIGTAPFENPPAKKSLPCSSSLQETQSSSNLEEVLKTKRPSVGNGSQNLSSDNIDIHNNDAVRSILDASQKPETTNNLAVLQSSEPSTKTDNNGEVYVFDGSLDTYLKSSGGTNQINPNPVYINTGGLIVMPPPETSKQFYIVNNQPLINMNVSAVKGVITDNDIMAMPTIIVNDETQTTFTNQTFTVGSTTVNRNHLKRNKRTKIAPKPSKSDMSSINEFLTLNTSVSEAPVKENKKVTATKSNLINSIASMESSPCTVVVTASQITPSVTTVPTSKTSTPRQASHVRNLDFSTPTKVSVETTKPPIKKKETVKAWDADLRSLAANCTSNRSPTPKRKKATTTRLKRKAKSKEKVQEVSKNTTEDKSEEAKTDEVTPSDEVAKEEEKVPVVNTPYKDDAIPKTPGTKIIDNSSHCTPFTAVLEEQLKGVDLISLPTPKIPITPGFAITPGLNLTSTDLVPYNNRSTDYSTSSSYYQPSDTEQNKSLDQLIEECRKLENNSPPPPLPPPPPPLPPTPTPTHTQNTTSNLKILSDVVIEQPRISRNQMKHTANDEKKKSCNEYLNKFNHSVIGKKNLSLLKRQPTTSSSSSDQSDSSDSDSEKSGEHSNHTIICKKNDATSINNIISKVQVKNTLDEETRKKNLLAHLEEVRQRTIHKIKNPPEPAKKSARNNNRKSLQNKTPKRSETKKTKSNKKKESAIEENNVDEEAQRLVKGLAQRGIHLVPKKSPPKKEKLLNNKESDNAEINEFDINDDESLVLFDVKTFESSEIVKHDEKVSRNKSLQDYDFNVLDKSFKAALFDEHLKEDVTRTIKCTAFETLLDIPSKINILTPRKTKRSVDEEVDNDLMDYIFTSGIREQSPDTKLMVKGGKKRKSRLSEDENKPTEKKSKTLENNIKLLKKIDVDVFLDKVHGE